MKKPNIHLICNIVSVAVLFVLLGTQFMPFWKCEDCKSHEEAKMVSVGEYVWVPEDHTPITKGMTDVYLERYGEDYEDEDGKKFKFQANDTIFPHVIIFAASILGLVMCVKYPEGAVTALFPLVGGVSGVIGYLTVPALQAGQNWQLHFAVSVVVTAAALAPLVYPAARRLRKRTAKA